MAIDRRLTTNDKTTDDPKTTVGISIRESLVADIKERARIEDVNFSAMCSRLLRMGLVQLNSTGN